MKKKTILFLLRDKDLTHTNRQHNSWVPDCQDIYNVIFWGKGICSSTSIKSLQKDIDRIRPDYIYATVRKRYLFDETSENNYWLPDLTNIRVPKIFVECDTWKYDPNDSWYKQFDKVLCRCPWWIYWWKPKVNWSKIPFFRWSVPEKAFPKTLISEKNRKDILFVGHFNRKGYAVRRRIKARFKGKIKFCISVADSYWETLKSAKALVCPCDSKFGEFLPSKLPEYLASGSPVVTNSTLMLKAGYGELEKFVIKYKDLEDLHNKINVDFRPYYNKAIEVMRNHTHKIRYKELFG
jgi:hypothetical protein